MNLLRTAHWFSDIKRVAAALFYLGLSRVAQAGADLEQRVQPQPGRPGLRERAPTPLHGKRWGARLDLQFGQATQTLQGDLVEASGERIWVESEPGQGTAFYFRLPAREGAKR